jgi:hypothetical protein
MLGRTDRACRGLTHWTILSPRPPALAGPTAVGNDSSLAAPPRVRAASLVHRRRAVGASSSASRCPSLPLPRVGASTRLSHKGRTCQALLRSAPRCAPTRAGGRASGRGRRGPPAGPETSTAAGGQNARDRTRVSDHPSLPSSIGQIPTWIWSSGSLNLGAIALAVCRARREGRESDATTTSPTATMAGRG